jgi:hypothetical protein
VIQSSDIAIRAAIRGVLTRTRADTSCLSIGAFRGVVRLRGELRRCTGDRRFSAETVSGIDQTIRRLRGVRRVDWQLDDWHRDPTGEWRRREETVPIVARETGATTDLDAPDAPDAE